MDLSWIEKQTFFEAPAESGGSGAVLDTSLEPASEPAPAAAEPAAEPAPAAAEPEPDIEIPVPEALAALFRPVPASQGAPPAPRGPDGYQAPAPATPPPGFPDPSLAITDPEAHAKAMNAYIQNQLEATKREIAMQNRAVQQRLEQEKQAKFQKAAAVAEKSIKQHYQRIFNKDPDFRKDKELQDILQDVVGYYLDARLNAGDIEGLEHTQEEIFARRVLQLAKAERNINSGPNSLKFSAPLAGAQPSGPRPAPMLTPDMRAAREAAAERGFKYSEEQLAKALKRRLAE